jgi:hypothetical protein
MDDSNVGMDVVKRHEHLPSPLLHHRKRNRYLICVRLVEDSVDTGSQNRCDDHGVVSMLALNVELIDKTRTVATAGMVRVCVLDAAKD